MDTAMLGNRALLVKLAPKNKKNNDAAPSTMEEAIGDHSARIVTDLAKDFVKYSAITVGVAVVGFKLVDTACKIALKKTKSADNQ